MSSPITQWREKIKDILWRLTPDPEAYEQEEEEGYNPLTESEALEAITSIAIKLLEQYIVDFEQCRNTEEIDVMARIKRQSLKEMT